MAGERFLLRASRNTMLDAVLNNVGNTYPLTDLPLKAKSNIVFYDEPAELILGDSQTDVEYLVYGDIDHGIAQTGTGAELKLSTLPLKLQAHAFRVSAIKKYDAKLSRPLLQTILITVGVNRNLEIVAEKQLVSYGEKATLIIKNTQKNARYAIFFEHDVTDKTGIEQILLLKDGTLPDEVLLAGDEETLPTNRKRYFISKSKLSKTGRDLSIETQYGLIEDIELKVWVFDDDTQQTGVLVKTTPITVTPNPGLPATWYSLTDGEPVNKSGAINYGGKVGITLQQTQRSVKYMVTVRDTDNDILDTPDEVAASAFVAGTGDKLDIPLDIPVMEDMLFTVWANKATVPHKTELSNKVLISAYPSTDSELSHYKELAGEVETVVIKVNKLQRGIIYQLRDAISKEAVSEPIFYHRNQGIGSMRVSKNNEGTRLRKSKINENEWIKGQFVIGGCDEDNDPALAQVVLQLNKDSKPGAVEVTAIKSTTGFAVVIGTIDLKDQ